MFNSSIWNVTAALDRNLTIFQNAEFQPYQKQLDGIHERLSQLKLWTKRDLFLNYSHDFNESDIKDIFYEKLRLLQRIRAEASDFMCDMRFKPEPETIALLHAITMVNCVVLYAMFCVASLFIKPFSNTFARLIFRLVSSLFFIALLNCLLFPTPLVRELPFQFSKLCVAINGVSKSLAEAFEPYM